jgi:hypothetical protein
MAKTNLIISAVLLAGIGATSSALATGCRDNSPPPKAICEDGFGYEPGTTAHTECLAEEQQKQQLKDRFDAEMATIRSSLQILAKEKTKAASLEDTTFNSVLRQERELINRLIELKKQSGC